MFLTVLPWLSDRDRQFPVAVIGLHLIVAAHGKIDRHGALPRGVEQIERLMPNGPFADGDVNAAAQGADAGQNDQGPFHCLSLSWVIDNDLDAVSGSSG